MSATRTADGRRAVLLECPACKTLSVADPLWETAKDLLVPCENCCDYDVSKPHKVIVVEIPTSYDT